MLSEGANAFSAVAEDDLGNPSQADSITVTLDTTAPAAPVITTNGGNGAGVDFTTSNAALVLQGACASDTATIEVNGSASGVSYTAGSTTWSYSTTLNEGANAFSITASDSLDNTSAVDTVTVTLDTTAPGAPIITTDGGSGPGADFETSNVSLTLDGTCDSDTAVIKVNGQTNGVTYTPGDTNWTFSASLNVGTNNFSVNAQDAMGNVSAPATMTVTLDTSGPPSPVITTDGGNGPGEDYLTNQPSLTLEGTCDAATVAIQVNGSADGVDYTPGETNWTYTTTILVEGENAFAVTAQDQHDNLSVPAAITVTLDTTPPPTIRPDIVVPGG